jgi:hypothetical protein
MKIVIKNERKPEVMKTLENKSERATTLLSSKLAAFGAATLVAVAFALVVGTFTHQAGATPPSGGGATGASGNWIAVGAFTPAPNTGGPGMSAITHVAFAAQRNPRTLDSTTAGTGYVVEELSTGTISGHVTCLTVNVMFPNEARIQWTVTHADSGTGVATNTIRQLDVDDLGEPNMMGMSLDRYTDRGECSTDTMTCGTGTNPPCCACGTTPGGSNAIVHGNIVVKSS